MQADHRKIENIIRYWVLLQELSKEKETLFKISAASTAGLTDHFHRGFSADHEKTSKPAELTLPSSRGVQPAAPHRYV